MKKKLLAMALTLAVILTILPVAASAADSSFSDVPKTHWAHDYIEYGAGTGIIYGVGNGKFDPNGTVTQAMFVTLMCRTAFRDWASPTPAPGETWYDSAWRAAETFGLYENTYLDYTMVDAEINRFDMAQFIRNICVNIYGYSDVPGTIAAKELKDFFINPQRVLDGIAFCYENGIITGYEDGTFRGGVSMTRAQAAAVIYRLVELLRNNPDFNEPGTGTLPSTPEEPGVTTSQAVKEALNEYRSYLDRPGKVDFGDYSLEPFGFKYALIEMQPGDSVPTLLLKLESTDYIDYVRVFKYDPYTKSMILPPEILTEGTAMVGGYRGSISMAGDGNGLLSMEFNSGTGHALVSRATIRSGYLDQSLVWEGNFDLMPTNITFVEIEWYDVDDLSGLNGWTV